MNTPFCGYVDTDYYKNLFVQILGNQYGFLFLDPRGEPVTRSGLATPGVCEHLKGLAVRDKGTSEARPGYYGKCAVPEGDFSVFLHPLFGVDKETAGHFCIIRKGPALPPDAPEYIRLSQALTSVCKGIEKEYLLNQELALMSEECAGGYEELHLVYDIGDHIMEDPYNANIFGKLIGLCIEYLAVDMAVFIKSDRKEAEFSIDATSGFDQSEQILTVLKENVYDFVSKTKKKLFINAPGDPKRGRLLGSLPLKLLSIPVLDHEKSVKGVLTILRNPDREDFLNSDKNLMVSIAQQFSVLLKNQEMYNELKIFTDQISACLIESIDAKDPYTRGHSDRVNEYSMEIGREMGLPDEELWWLDWASKLHDIGKIGVPDGVLTKPAKLTEEEYKIIQAHPERGYEILKTVNFLGPATAGVRHHHEKFDGTGFPHRLKGDAIPLHARIIAVSDTYDAMTSTRAYRAALSHKEALDEIDRVSGTQLDEMVVRYLKKIFEKNPVLQNLEGRFGD